MSITAVCDALKNVGRETAEAIESALVFARDFAVEELSAQTHTDGDNGGVFRLSPKWSFVYTPSTTLNQPSIFIDLTADEQPDDACSTECKIVLGAIGLAGAALSDDIPFSVGVRLF